MYWQIEFRAVVALMIFFVGLAAANRSARADFVEDWGEAGQLGNGTNVSSNTPVAVIGMTSGVTAVAVGPGQSLAVQNGGAYAWGANGSGELGNGTTTYSNTPVAVTFLSSGVTAVAGGGSLDTTFAIQNGCAYAWGWNGEGMLGNGSFDENAHATPVAVSGLSSGVTAIGAGVSYAAAIQNGGVYTWGNGSFGELGYGGTLLHHVLDIQQR